ncbi:hypothetical protein M9Y10_030462 [Tritrichomonas musculus]|uniref:Uncharacterized protein n=1 Tax=Tritrichomonas musculus TaxID=1915356 RepID=A0ABR2GMT7_9EUKA
MKNGKPIKIKGKDIFPKSKKPWNHGYHNGDDYGFGNKQTVKSRTKDRNKSLREQLKAFNESLNPAHFGDQNIKIENGNMNKYIDDLKNQVMSDFVKNPTVDIEIPDYNDYKKQWKDEFNQIKERVFDELAQYEYTVEDSPDAKENLMKKGQDMIKQLIDSSNYTPQEKEMLMKQADNLIKKDKETGKTYFYDSDSDDDDRYSYLKRKLRKRIMDSDSDSDDERLRKRRILRSSDRTGTIRDLMERRKRNFKSRYGDSSSDDEELSFKKRLNKLKRLRERETEKETYKKLLLKEKEKELEKKEKEREKIRKKIEKEIEEKEKKLLKESVKEDNKEIKKEAKLRRNKK